MIKDIITTLYCLQHGLTELNPFFHHQTIIDKVAWTYSGIVTFAFAYKQAEKENASTSNGSSFYALVL